MYIDTHCHLDFEVFDESRADLMKSCAKLGVKGFLVPATTQNSWHKIAGLAKDYPEWRIAFGLHPYFLAGEVLSSVDLLAQSCEQGNAIAIGEIGLDCWPGSIELETQQHFFIRQLSVARDLGLPVILHARKSYDLVLKAIREAGFRSGGVVHAFNGSLVQANRFREVGFVLGIGGTITYPRAEKAKRVLAQLDDGAFVLETDSPDMPLQGRQGQINTPLSIPRIAACVADIRETSVEDVALQAHNNLLSVFSKWYEDKS